MGRLCRAILLLFVCNVMVSDLLASDYPVRYLGIENGLSNNAVVNIYQDYKGFMWFGTYDGLNRYDGYKFKIYRNKIGDSTSLRDNSIYTVEGDVYHRLWVGSRKGVSVFNPVNEQFSTAKYTPCHSKIAKEESGNVHIIRAGRYGIVLVGTENDGLLQFEENIYTGRQIPLKDGTREIAGYEVTGIDFDNIGADAWIFVQNVGLCRYNSGKHTIDIINRDIRRANCLRTGDKEDLWIGTDNGLFRYDKTTATYSRNYIQAGGKIVNLCIDLHGALWAASDGRGVFIIRSPQDTTAFSFADNKHRLSSNSVYAVYEDNAGRKWIGTLRGGINIIESRRNPFERHTFKEEGAVNNFILSFCEGAGNDIWIGTDGGGLRYWDKGTNNYISYTTEPGNNNAISSNFITGILRDAQDDIWVSTWFGGINRIKKGTHSFEHFQCFNPFTAAVENNAWEIYEDAQKRIWASTTNNGTLYTFNRTTNRFDLFDKKLVNIQCLAEDAHGQLWGGNYGDLICIDREHKKHRIYHIGYTIRAIHEDKKGNFWVGTDGGGLLLFDVKTGAFTRFTDTNGLPSNSILRLLEDNQGNLWLSTFNGLVRFDPQKRTSRNFFQSDGLQSNQFSYNAAVKLRSGEFMFGGIKGFNIFYPDSIHGQIGIPPVFLTGIRINNIPVEQNDAYVSARQMENVQELKIPYNKAAVSLDFVVPEYTSPEKISYAYQLDGWDKMWNYVGEVRTANYTRLQEGNYAFKVKVTNAEGKWGPEIQTLRIIVLPPWYRSWWAYLLYGACIITGLWLFIQYKSRQERLKYEVRLAHLETEKEKEINERKLSFFTNISHEFRTPLTLIINPLKAYIQNAGSDMDISVVYRNTRRLLSLVDQLLLFRKADAGGDQLKIARLDLVELCNEVFLCFSQQAKVKQIDYQFVGGNERIEIYGDNEKIEIALFNLLSNAFKFTPDRGTILFQIREEAEDVEILIKDSGCGIPAGTGNSIFEKFRRGAVRQEQQPTGFGIGLYLVKHFIDSHQGNISYHSQLNEGTTFVIRLKKGAKHLSDYDFTENASVKSTFLEELTVEPLSTGRTTEKKEKKGPEELITEKRSILLIDDNIEIRNYVRQLFQDDFLIYEADNGDEGFASVQQFMPDLVISDVQMQGMDGVELCTRIKQTEDLSHIPVILLTATPDLHIKGIAGGADDYITKPFDKDLLLAKVHTIIKNRNLLQQYFLNSITLQKSDIKVPAEYRDFLKKCIEIVEANLGNEDFSIKTFTIAIGMSHSSLYKKVKSISGQTVNAFIRSIRLRRAAVLMLKENYTISQAAFQVGIGDVKYFREQFFKLFGMNPSDYVRKYRHSFNQELNVSKEQG